MYCVACGVVMDYGFRDRDKNRSERRGREFPDENKSIKNVTIRGVDGQIYDEFSQVIQSSGMTMGDALSKMMRDVSRDFDEVFPKLSATNLKYMMKKDKISVEHFDNLSVSLKDLEETDKRVRFQHIRCLTIEEDITIEAFETYIARIEHCGIVRIPEVLPKLLIYSKISHSDQIEIYPRIEGDQIEPVI